MKNTKITVLDKGFVELVDSMGGDTSIVDAARVSISGKDVKASTSDRNLIRYLLRHQHTSPFEMVQFIFNCKMPIFVARQWIRHRTSSVNEMSARYSVLPNDFYIPDLDRIQEQAADNKQGSGGLLPEEVRLDIQNTILTQSEQSYELYEYMLSQGTARELARMVLPTNIYTQWFWRMDLHNLMHFLKLRLDPHAQYEIRMFAQAIGTIVAELCPIAWEAFIDYKLEAGNFSSQELEVIRSMNQILDAIELKASNREKAEFRKKLGL